MRKADGLSVILTMAVVARVQDARRGLTSLAAVARAIWRALVSPRQAVAKRALAAWESAREMGINTARRRASHLAV